MSPRGRGRDAELAGVLGLRVRSCQARLVPRARGHCSRTRGFPLAAAGSGGARREHKDVQSCRSGHRAAIPLPQLLATHEATTYHAGVPHVPSCTPRPKLPWLPAPRHRLSSAPRQQEEGMWSSARGRLLRTNEPHDRPKHHLGWPSRAGRTLPSTQLLSPAPFPRGRAAPPPPAAT